MKLSDIVVIPDEQRRGDAGKQVTTVGGELKAERSRARSSFALSLGPAVWHSLITRWLSQNVSYLKTQLYGYFTYSFKDSAKSPRLTPNSILEYFDTFEALVVRNCNSGGAPKGLILKEDSALRTELFRLNGCPTTYPNHAFYEQR